jgi:phosphate transport system substrate-binding protein
MVAMHLLPRAVLLTCSITALLLAGCSDPEAGPVRLGLASAKLTGVVRISGSSTMAPMVRVLASDFQKLHPGVTVNVQGGGSGQGLKDVKEGRSEIGMVSRVLTAEERDWLPFVIARDGIAVVIHADNPVATLSNEQVSRIYTKKIANWREVGGRDAPIHVIAASSQAGSTELFLHHFGIQKDDLKPDTLAEVNPERYAALARIPNAILYSSLGESERRAAGGEKVKALPSAGIPATSDNLAAGRYAIARPLALVTKGLPTGASKAFIDYARSAAAIPVIDRFEFVPYRD